MRDNFLNIYSMTLLVLVQCVGVYAVVQIRAVKKIQEACVGQDTILSFPFVTDENADIVHWYKTTKEGKITVAQYRDTFNPMGNFRGKVDIISRNGEIKLKNVNLNDEGTYICVVEAGTHTGNASLYLEVSEPPSKLPEIVLQEKDNSVIEIECLLNPSDSGNPAVDIYIEDEYGRKQRPNRLTISKERYKCCITGRAARCFNGSNSEKHCTEQVYKTGVGMSGCEENVIWKCFLISVGFCLGFCVIVFMGWAIVIFCVKRRHLIAFIHTRKIPTPVRTAFWIWTGSQLANMFIASTFCIFTQGCYDVTKNLWIGLGCCFASTMAASHMTIAYYIADSWNKHKKNDLEYPPNLHGSRSTEDSDLSLEPMNNKP